jgi:hypothetical protein
MKNKYKVIIVALVAVFFTVNGLIGAIGALEAWGLIYGGEFALGTLVIPVLLWIIAFHYYREYKKEKKQK